MVLDGMRYFLLKWQACLCKLEPLMFGLSMLRFENMMSTSNKSQPCDQVYIHSIITSIYMNMKTSKWDQIFFFVFHGESVCSFLHLIFLIISNLLYPWPGVSNTWRCAWKLLFSWGGEFGILSVSWNSYLIVSLLWFGLARILWNFIFLPIL